MDISAIKKVKDNFQFEKFLAVFALVDVCLLPYIRPLRCTSSMLLLLAWYIHRFLLSKPNLRNVLSNLKQDKEAMAFIASCVLVVISALVGVIVLPANIPSSYQSSEVNVFSRTVTYSAIYIFTFLYYFFYREMAKKYDVLIYKTLKVIMLSIFIFAIVYLISTPLFYYLRTIWSLSGKVIHASIESSSYHRYTFSYSDPNSIAAMVVAIAILIVEQKNENIWIKVGAGISCVVTLLGTMSVQGVLGLAVYAGVKIVVFLYNLITRKRRLEKRTVWLLLAGCVGAVFVMLLLAQHPVIQRALQRILNNSGSMQTRLRLWTSLIKEEGVFKFVLWGRGNAILLNGVEILPHNGHLHILYSYGFIAYLLFMYVFFWKKTEMQWKKMLFLLPLFVCFTINVGLLDSRYSFTMAMVTAFGCHCSKKFCRS